MATSQLSQQAYDRLQEELAERSGPRRKEISAWIERAREQVQVIGAKGTETETVSPL